MMTRPNYRDSVADRGRKHSDWLQKRGESLLAAATEAAPKETGAMGQATFDGWMITTYPRGVHRLLCMIGLHAWQEDRSVVRPVRTGREAGEALRITPVTSHRTYCAVCRVPRG